MKKKSAAKHYLLRKVDQDGNESGIQVTAGGLLVDLELHDSNGIDPETKKWVGPPHRVDLFVSWEALAAAKAQLRG